MNEHRKEVAQQVGMGVLLFVGVIGSGVIGCIFWLLAVMYV
jgi:hypothetical protein